MDKNYASFDKCCSVWRIKLFRTCYERQIISSGHKGWSVPYKLHVKAFICTNSLIFFSFSQVNFFFFFGTVEWKQWNRFFRDVFHVMLVCFTDTLFAQWHISYHISSFTSGIWSIAILPTLVHIKHRSMQCECSRSVMQICVSKTRVMLLYLWTLQETFYTPSVILWSQDLR